MFDLESNTDYLLSYLKATSIRDRFIRYFALVEYAQIFMSSMKLATHRIVNKALRGKNAMRGGICRLNQARLLGYF